MKIGIDVRALASGVHSGVEEYTIGFLRALFVARGDDTFVLFANAYRGRAQNLAWVREYPNVRIKQFRIPNKLLNLSLWLLHYPKLDKLIGGCDIFIMPNINFCAVSRRTPLVVTMHDLSFVHWTHTFSWRRRMWHWLVAPRALARRAWRIVAVSGATRQDICTTYRLRPSKVVTIHNAHHDQFSPISRNGITLINIQQKYNLPYRFILYLGTIEPRKNLVGLVRAYCALRAHYPGEYDKVPLVIAGARGWKSRDILAEIAASDYADDIILLGFVDEDDKPALYNLATVFVYPSFFEGFGFPPLEAMACGTPVITSNNSALPEIVGNAALMIDPDRPEEITQAMHALLADTNLRKTITTRGLARATQFASWDVAAQHFAQEILTQLPTNNRH